MNKQYVLSLPFCLNKWYFPLIIFLKTKRKYLYIFFSIPLPHSHSRSLLNYIGTLVYAHAHACPHAHAHTRTSLHFVGSPIREKKHWFLNHFLSSDWKWEIWLVYITLVITWIIISTTWAVINQSKETKLKEQIWLHGLHVRHEQNESENKHNRLFPNKKIYRIWIQCCRFGLDKNHTRSNSSKYVVKKSGQVLFINLLLVDTVTYSCEKIECCDEWKYIYLNHYVRLIIIIIKINEKSSWTLVTAYPTYFWCYTM